MGKINNVLTNEILEIIKAEGPNEETLEVLREIVNESLDRVIEAEIHLTEAKGREGFKLLIEKHFPNMPKKTRDAIRKIVWLEAPNFWGREISKSNFGYSHEKELANRQFKSFKKRYKQYKIGLIDENKTLVIIDLGKDFKQVKVENNE